MPRDQLRCPLRPSPSLRPLMAGRYVSGIEPLYSSWLQLYLQGLNQTLQQRSSAKRKSPSVRAIRSLVRHCEAPIILISNFVLLIDSGTRVETIIKADKLSVSYDNVEKCEHNFISTFDKTERMQMELRVSFIRLKKYTRIRQHIILLLHLDIVFIYKSRQEYN
jgi:hypothetical protein